MKTTSSKLSKTLALTLGIFMAAASVAIAPVIAEAQQAKKGNKAKAGKRGGAKLTPAQRAARKANKAKKANAAAGKKKKASASKKAKAKAPAAKKRKAAKKKIVVKKKIAPFQPSKSDFMRRLYGNSISGRAVRRGVPNSRYVETRTRIFKKKPIIKKKRIVQHRKNRGRRGRLGSFNEIRGEKNYRGRRHGGRYGERRQLSNEAKLKRKIYRALNRWF